MERLLMMVEIVGSVAIGLVLSICVIAGVLFVGLPLTGSLPWVPASIGIPALVIDMAMIGYAIYRGACVDLSGYRRLWIQGSWEGRAARMV